MSRRDDRAFLEDMLERANLVDEFTTEGREVFMTSRLVQEAVIRSLEVIGEATRKVSDECKATYPDIPWREMGAFRNFAIHVYWNIKLERVWDIVENDLSPLQQQLQSALDSMPDDDIS